MSKFAIFVTVKVKPGMGADFMPIILENATAAVRTEPDCHMFHVMTSKDDPDIFHFFEVYTNQAALDAHREYAHFKKFRAETEDMVVDRVIQMTNLLQ